MFHTVLVVIAVVGIIGYVIGAQLRGEPQRGKRLVLLPVILTAIGAADLGNTGRHLQALDVAFVAIGGVVAAGIGVGQGAMMRLEQRDGSLWGRQPVSSLWLWGALVGSRLILAVIAHSAGAQVAASTAPILLMLGINRLAQAGCIVPRAIRAGIPFAPERDGSTFLATINAGRQEPSAPWQAAGLQVASAVGVVLRDRRGRRRGGRL